ncbi:hypothetical protein EBR66_03655 [bacterium]|nr:hypothetical protein [bacterium]
MKKLLSSFIISLCALVPFAASAASTFDYLWENTFHYTTLFESLDGYHVSGNASVDGSQLLLVADNTTGTSEVKKTPAWQGVITFSQRSRFRTTIAMADSSKAVVYYGIGDRTRQGYGFKIVDGFLYGYTNDGTTEKTTLVGAVKPGEIYTLEARFKPNSMAVFYVNRVIMGTIKSSLPRATKVPNRNFFTITLISADGTAKSFQTSYFEYLQTRNE